MASALYDAGLTGGRSPTELRLVVARRVRSTPTRHNMIGILSEAASARIASPVALPADSVRQPPRGVNSGTLARRHLAARGIVRYELVASEALVRLAALDRDQLSSTGRGAAAARLTPDGRTSLRLHPPSRPSAILSVGHPGECPARGRVEVWRAAESFRRGESDLPAGSLVVPMGPAVRAHARTCSKYRGTRR